MNNARSSPTTRVDYAVSIVIFLALLGAVVNTRLLSTEQHLPAQFRITSSQLSALPVEMGDLRSCPCWQGPRDLGQRKFKFSITNRTSRTIDIGGGPDSGVRLLIAYSVPVPDEILLPAADRGAEQTAESPPDLTVFRATRLERFVPQPVTDDVGAFGIPDEYEIYAFPAMPNRIVENVGESATYATVVENTELLPDTRFFDSRRGHGAWNFMFPTSDTIRTIYPPLGQGGGLVPARKREAFEDEVIFVGIAIFDANGDLIGFAPSPTEAAWSSPSDL